MLRASKADRWLDSPIPQNRGLKVMERILRVLT